MNKTLLSLLVASTLSVAATSAFAEDAAPVGPFDKDNFSANIAFTSNYIFRGLSLSANKPAVQGGFDWAYNGFYVGTWGSSIKAVEDESVELDYYAGYTGEIGGFTYSADFIYYDYPGDNGTFDNEAKHDNDLAYYEYGGSVGYNFGGDLEPTIGLSILHSPDFFGETGSTTAYEGSVGVALPWWGLSASALYGRQDLDKKYQVVGGYDYWGASLSKTVGKFDLTASWADTDHDGEKFVSGTDTNRFYFTVGSSF
jgi:uncharacterized protein (TIGR02001 family)